MAFEYRRRKGSDVWHFCTNCPDWPTKDYESRWEKPTSGELDNTCRAMERDGRCSKNYKK